MKKKQLLSALALSTIALTQTGFVSADEFTPVDFDSSVSTTEILTPTDSTVTPTDPTQPVETPTDPNQPTAPVEPETSPVNPTIPSTPDSVVPIDPTTPSTEPSTDSSALQGKDTAGDNVVVPDSSTQGDDKVGVTDPTTPSAPQGKDTAGDNVGTEPSKSSMITPPNAPAEENPNHTKPIPEQTLPFNPFKTKDGQTIVGTQDSQVIVQQADGSTNLVSPESVGGTTNADGTVTLNAASGEVKTLPRTGDEAGGFLSFLGTTMLLTLGFFKKKML